MNRITQTKKKIEKGMKSGAGHVNAAALIKPKKKNHHQPTHQP
jgi:hypothetical protein